MTKSTKIALTAILLFLHLSLRPILVFFQGVTYLYFIIKIDSLQKMSGLVVSKMETPEALLVDGKPMPNRLLSIVQNLISKDFNK